MKPEPTRTAASAKCGLRREAQRHAAFQTLGGTRKAVSSLRSATALQKLASLCLCAFAFLLLPVSVLAATNDLTSALQKGLFEEEANHNLEAAAQAYHAVSARFDQDRKLAATAIFRLGEVYRKQGRTNEASAQYERIVREFSDQETLATLSRQNLTVLRRSFQSTATVALSPTARLEQRRLLEAEIKLLETKVKSEKLLYESGRADLDSTIATQRDLLALRRQLVALSLDATPEHIRAEQGRLLDEEIGLVEQKLVRVKAMSGDREYSSVLSDTERELLTLKRQRITLGNELLVATTSEAAATLVTDEEEKEIRRIQAMIQNSPDLINAPQAEEGTPLFQAASKGQLQVAKFLLAHSAAVNAPAGVRGKTWSSWTPLIAAANSGHKTMVELLLSHGADVELKDAFQGNGPLHFATRNGFVGVAEALLAHRANPNAKTRDDNTPLHLAAKGGKMELVELLLAKGADINARDANGQTPLIHAATSSRAEIVKVLLNGKADPNAKDNQSRTALSHAAQSSTVSEVIVALLVAKANPNIADEAGFTPLSYATQRGSESIVKPLIEAKADVNVVDRQGFTPLVRANGNTNVVKLLLEAKADPNLGTSESPLLQAVRLENGMLAEMLLRAGANPNRETECDLLSPSIPLPTPGIGFPGSPQPSTGATKRTFSRSGQRGKRTPLQAAVLEERPAMLKLLLQFKGDPKANDAEGFPLVLSALNNAEMLKVLLEAGADANAADGKGQAALIAARTGNAEAIDLLLKHGAKTEVRDEHGNTPLLAAIVNGSTNCVASLLAAGADVNAKSSSDWSALHGAVYYGRGAILQMLLAKGANPNVRDTSGRTPLDVVKPQSTVAIPPLRPGEAPRTSRLELADLLRQHGALDDLPDFTAIRITRQGLERPIGVFRSDTNDWNRFTLLETIMSFYSRPGLFTGVPGQLLAEWLPFPDFGRIIIRRPDRTKVGKEQEIKVSLLNTSNVVDCARDVPLEFGDVIEIPERIHALNEPATNPLADLEGELRLHNLQRMIPTRSLRQPASTPAPPVEPGSADTDSARTRLACLLKTVQLVIQGQSTDIAVFAPTEGWLANLLQRSEARSVLRSSSDLARVKVTRRDKATGQAREFIVDLSKNPPLRSDVWLNDGDVIEVPDKP